MQKLDILLQKRSAKMVIYLGAALFSLLVCVLNVGALVKDFKWWQLIILALILVVVFITGRGLFQYFTYKNVHLVVESDGETIKFYNTHDGGVFNEIDSIKLVDMKRFYIKKTRTRYLMTNYSFEFVPKSSLGGILIDEITCFPSLYEASEDEMKRILLFVQEVAPEIELGYENIWQRLTK